MLKRLRSRLHGEDGFTLIELLVVILIIGILAAIAIPSFLNQKSKASDANTKSEARTAQTAMETYYTDHGNYTDASVSALTQIESTLSSADLAVTPGASTYTVSVTDHGRTYSISKDSSGNISHSCTVADRNDAGGCVLPASGTSGSW
ncbi:MAG TPA: type II secretion system protein [Solirubrobacteraceae bacterium]|jgi:type IV pilus assembly protein PilA|nr:type II secretion system protein [Solirubrobacteraceae bacterium]